MIFNPVTLLAMGGAIRRLPRYLVRYRSEAADRASDFPPGGLDRQT